jgi:RNA polymerase sigma factor (sigma-70 family)
MSWLYDRRHQLDRLGLLAEIAHWAVWAVVDRVSPEDRDDVEQEIVIHLIEAVEKYGVSSRSYLNAVAKNRICDYLRKRYRERKRLYYVSETDKGELVSRTWDLLHDGDGDARLDAIATLATLPKRLIEIGYKRLNGEKLTDQESDYCTKQLARLRPKLKCRRYGIRLSESEKRRVLELHSKGMSMSRIARTMGRSNKAVMRILAGYQPLSRRDWLAKMKIAAEERKEQIRHVYFVEGRTINQIAKEFHCSRNTVRTAIAGQHS